MSTMQAALLNINKVTKSGIVLICIRAESLYFISSCKDVYTYTSACGVAA